MELFRISLDRFSSKLVASGYANRWNHAGEYIIYCSSSRSLAALEMIVQGRTLLPRDSYKMMIVFVPDNENLVDQLFIKKLPVDWRKPDAYRQLQDIGSKWIKEKRSLLLKIPSVVIPQEYNYAINTAHPDFKKNVKLVRLEDYFGDERLE